MNRKTALDIIRAEYAEHGEMTQKAMRAYAESSISCCAFWEAKKARMQIHQEAQKHD